MNRNLSKVEWILLAIAATFLGLSLFLYYSLCKNLFSGGFNDIIEIIVVLGLFYCSFIAANYSITMLAEKYCSRRNRYEEL
ncbi:MULTISPECIES: hypothetical protein [Vibrio]|uniref:Uncharacterized protein n=1 Tax=Vibrio splendidus 12E03 TaxID=1191305 RepID=A0A1E5FV67_VIBSP|nr:hypothetical protein [Vibrio splendidus]OEF94385.1 hypothetical protein A142_03780 [Vibrio splendidus 12E03]